MALSRVKTWIAAEVLLASDLNAEFNNLINNAGSLISPATANFDLDGFSLVMDSDADSAIKVSTDDLFEMTLSGVSLFHFDGTTASSVNGMIFYSAATGNGVRISPRGSDTDISMLLRPKGTTTGIVQIEDGGGNEIAKFGPAVSSAINEMVFKNSAAGNAVTITATGGDTDVSINLVPKGAGTVQAGGTQVVVTSRTLTAGSGISGGGDLSSNRTFDLEFTELTEKTALVLADIIAIADTEASNAIKKATLTNLWKTINALTEDTAPDPDSDFVPAYDTSASGGKKILPYRLGSYVLLSATAASGAASVAFSFPSITGSTQFYNFYIQGTDIVPGTDTDLLFLRTATDAGGTSFDAGVADYSWATHEKPHNGADTTTEDASDSEVTLTGPYGLGSASGESCDVEVWIPGPAVTTHNPLIKWSLVLKNSAGVGAGVNGTGIRLANGDVTGVQILASSGTITGNFRLYGVY